MLRSHEYHSFLLPSNFTITQQRTQKVKGQLVDPRLHDLESTEERASDALQRAQAKPQKLEQAQKVVCVLECARM